VREMMVKQEKAREKAEAARPTEKDKGKARGKVMDRETEARLQRERHARTCRKCEGLPPKPGECACGLPLHRLIDVIYVRRANTSLLSLQDVYAQV
jgi:hypothetical protein